MLIRKKKLVYVGFGFGPHGKYSGYNQIKEYIAYDMIINCQDEFNRLLWIRQHQNLLTRIYFKIFGNRLWITECRLILLSIRRPNDFIFHIVYGENIYKYLGFFKRGNEIVLSLHQPPAFFLNDEFYWLRILRKVNKLIVMSRDMESFFKTKFANLQVKYIPHGVNTFRFVPAGEKQDQLLMVGNWLRDFEFASLFFRALKSNMPDIRIVVLTDRQNHAYFANLDIDLLSVVSDDELLILYQKSKILFLPLKGFTANNALLEACSAGCHVVISTDEVNKSYDPDSPVLFIDKSIPEALRVVEYSLRNYSQNVTDKTRSYIIRNFTWERIGEETARFILS